MRADPDHQEDLEEVTGSRPSFEGRPRARPLSPRPPSPAPGPAPSSTPLLTATLNAPLQSFYSGGSVRVKCPTDLQLTLPKKPKAEAEHAQSSGQGGQGGQGSQGGQGGQGGSQAVFYSTLLKQLRQKAGDGVPVQAVPQKGRKEKCRSLPYQCPACKKRFQRPIALNSHIQNEHISAASPGGERSCRLCGAVCGSLAGIRHHLLAAHAIDLDNPALCLVEERRYSVLEASLRSGREEEEHPSCSNLDMSGSSASCSPAHTPSSSESPERGVPRQEEEEVQVEDLSLRRPSPSPHLRSVGTYSPAPASPRAESPRPAKQPSKRPRLRELSPSPTFSSSSSSSSTPASPSPRHTCQHCHISYPNQTLYFLHKGFHSEGNPWRCNSCGHQSTDLYDFNTHLFSMAHQ